MTANPDYDSTIEALKSQFKHCSPLMLSQIFADMPLIVDMKEQLFDLRVQTKSPYEKLGLNTQGRIPQQRFWIIAMKLMGIETNSDIGEINHLLTDGSLLNPNAYESYVDEDPTFQALYIGIWYLEVLFAIQKTGDPDFDNIFHKGTEFVLIPQRQKYINDLYKLVKQYPEIDFRNAQL